MGGARGRRTRIFAAASLVAATWASACGEAGTEPTPADPPHPVIVAVAPEAVTLRTLGDTTWVSADVRDQYGIAMAGAHVSWLSRNPTVAEVNPAGLVTAVGNGATTVVAEIRRWEVRGSRMMAAGRISDSVAIRVDAPSFTLSGTVTDQRRPSLVLPGVHVRLEGWKRTTTTTDTDGRYSFQNVGGTLQVSAHAEFSYVSQTVDVHVDGDLTRNFAMEHNGVAPFSGTSWVTPAILGPDSTVLETLTYAGRGMREVYDRRLRKWIRINAFLFDARIVEWMVEFRANPQFGDVETAKWHVDRFAPSLGRLPAVFLADLSSVAINGGDGNFGGSPGSILIHANDPATWTTARKGFLEEVFLHEAAHAVLDEAHARADAWRAAQAADGVFISEYAANNPVREDIAETAVMYFAVRYRPESLTTEDRWRVLTSIPNRLAYFEEQGLDMSPYKATGSLVPGLEPGSVAGNLGGRAADSFQRTVLPAAEPPAVAREVAVSPREEGTCEGEPEDPAQPWTAWEYPQELLDGPCAFPGVAGGCARPHKLQRLLEARGIDPGEASRHSVFLIGDDLDGTRRISPPQEVDEAQTYGAVAVVDDGMTGGRARDHMPRGCG
jgi:hypothetical protein